MAAPSKTRDQRQSARPLTRLERASLLDALRYARCEPAAMRPLLNRAEAATLDMYRRIRHADKGAIPGVARIAEFLGWKRSATIEQLEALRRKGFIKRAHDCSLYLESCEAVVFKCADALLALAVSLASIDPSNEIQWRKYAVIQHANAIDVCRRMAEFVKTGKTKVSKRAKEGIYHGPQLPSLQYIPVRNRKEASKLLLRLKDLETLRQAA